MAPTRRLRGGASGRKRTPLTYVTYLGSNNSDQGRGITVDAQDDAFVTGTTSPTNFPVTPGSFQPTGRGHGANEAFVAEFAPDGGRLVYATFLGGTGGDIGNSIAVDSRGDAYVTGSTNATNFPVTPGAFQTKGGGRFGDAFVAELAPGGGELLYATYLGGRSDDEGAGIALDGQGDAYLTGDTISTNFPVTPSAFQTTSGRTSFRDAFVAEVASGGDRLLYATYLGGGGNDAGYGIAVDGQGNAYVTGAAYSPGFPVTPGVLAAGVPWRKHCQE